MKKSTALTLAGLMAISGAASASMSRWNGFGASQAFIADVGDIWTLPAVVASNPNATYFEFGNGSGTDYTNFGYNNIGNNAWGGANMALGPGVLAIWGNRPYNEGSLINFGGSFTVPNSGSASSFIPTPEQQIDLIYAFGINENATLGIGINRATNSFTEEVASGGVTTKEEESANDFGISLGADLKNLGPIALLEIGLQYNMISSLDSFNNGSSTDKAEGTGSDIDLRVGADIKGEKNSFQRIELGLNIDSLNYKDEPAATPPSGSYVESKNSGMQWNLGWAKGMSSDKGMGLGGFMLTGLTQSRDQANLFGADTVDKFDHSNLTLAFVCAGEGKIKEWLTARAGLSSNLFDSDTTVTDQGASGSSTKTTDVSSGSANTTLTTGLSLIFGDITIDGVLNQDVLFTGGYLFSGIPAALFSQVSATWAWGGAKE